MGPVHGDEHVMFGMYHGTCMPDILPWGYLI
jgi:hypothetical protein